MSDLSWCTHCDNAISHFSESLYCSEQCLRADALRNHPLLGYTYPEFVDFPRPYAKQTTPDSILSTGIPSAPLTRNSSDSIRTLPILSTSHSSCQSSPALSACDTTSTSSTTTPPPLHLPPAISMKNSSLPSNNCTPSFLLMGAPTATTALSRPFIVDYRPIH